MITQENSSQNLRKKNIGHYNTEHQNTGTWITGIYSILNIED